MHRAVPHGATRMARLADEVLVIGLLGLEFAELKLPREPLLLSLDKTFGTIGVCRLLCMTAVSSLFLKACALCSCIVSGLYAICQSSCFAGEPECMQTRSDMLTFLPLGHVSTWQDADVLCSLASVLLNSSAEPAVTAVCLNIAASRQRTKIC